MNEIGKEATLNAMVRLSSEIVLLGQGEVRV